jgi:hypothetical protein
MRPICVVKCTQRLVHAAQRWAAPPPGGCWLVWLLTGLLLQHRVGGVSYTVYNIWR